MSAHPLAVGTSVVGEPPLQTACLEKRHRQTLGQIRRDSQAERGQGTQMRRWGGGQGDGPGGGSGAPEVRRGSQFLLLSSAWARVLEKDAIMVETEELLCGRKTIKLAVLPLWAWWMRVLAESMWGVATEPPGGQARGVEMGGPVPQWRGRWGTPGTDGAVSRQLSVSCSGPLLPPYRIFAPNTGDLT